MAIPYLSNMSINIKRRSNFHELIVGEVKYGKRERFRYEIGLINMKTNYIAKIAMKQLSNKL